jgi:hypothetical protein
MVIFVRQYNPVGNIIEIENSVISVQEFCFYRRRRTKSTPEIKERYSQIK